jgi:hypothetical protein
MTEKEAKQFLKNLDRHLLNWLGNQLADEIKGKIAEKLGFGTWWALLNCDYPYKKVVEAIGMGFALMYFYAFWIQNGKLGLNPYNPAKEDERDQYVQYLLYSWAGGNPGYIYQFSPQGERLRAEDHSVDAVMSRYRY